MRKLLFAIPFLVGVGLSILATNCLLDQIEDYQKLRHEHAELKAIHEEHLKATNKVVEIIEDMDRRLNDLESDQLGPPEMEP